MKKIFYCISAIILVMLSASCERDEMDEISGTHYIRVYINENIKNVTEGIHYENIEVPELTLPKALRVMLCDQITGEIVSERYLQDTGRDDKGYYFDGYVAADKGDYRLIVYNYGTETTQIRNAGNGLLAEAYTEPISAQYNTESLDFDARESMSLDNTNIIYNPDHLWTVSDPYVHIESNQDRDTIYAQNHEYYKANSIVNTYYYEVKVSGAQWIDSISSNITSIAGSKIIHDGEILTTSPSVQYLNMKKNKVLPAQKDLQTTTYYATFNTFGKQPNSKSSIYITLNFKMTDGSMQNKKIDITDLFYNEDAVQHNWLLDKDVISLSAPSK